jgi:hypothetical protein
VHAGELDGWIKRGDPLYRVKKPAWLQEATNGKSNRIRPWRILGSLQT